MGLETLQRQTKSSECEWLTVIEQGTNVNKLYKEGTVIQRFTTFLLQALYWIHFVFVSYISFSLIFHCQQLNGWIVNRRVINGELTPCSLIDKYRPARRHIPAENSNFPLECDVMQHRIPHGWNTYTLLDFKVTFSTPGYLLSRGPKGIKLNNSKFSLKEGKIF